MKRSAWKRGLHLFLLGAALAGCRGSGSQQEVVRRPPSYPTYPSYAATTPTQTVVSSTVVTPSSTASSRPATSGTITVVEHSLPTGKNAASDETSVVVSGTGDRTTVSATVPAAPSTEIVQTSVHEARPADVAAPATPRKSYVDLTAQPCFAHAPDYSWVCGQLVHFGRGNKWRLRYLSVDETDNYGGSVSLVDEGQLQNFQDGQYVRIEGLINQGEHGIAPLYQISSIRAIDKPEAAPAQP